MMVNSVQFPTPRCCVPMVIVEHTCAQPRCVPTVFHGPWCSSFQGVASRTGGHTCYIGFGPGSPATRTLPSYAQKPLPPRPRSDGGRRSAEGWPPPLCAGVPAAVQRAVVWPWPPRIRDAAHNSRCCRRHAAVVVEAAVPNCPLQNRQRGRGCVPPLCTSV